MEGLNVHEPERQGVIPRIASDLFNKIYQKPENIEFIIKISYFEIYLDRVRDLLNPNRDNLQVHETREGTSYVKGVTERFVASPTEVLEIIEEGKKNRNSYHIGDLVPGVVLCVVLPKLYNFLKACRCDKYE